MTREANRDLQYAAEEKPPWLLVWTLGLQSVILNLPAIALTPLVVLRLGAQPDTEASWVVFAAILAAGAATLLQAYPILRIGSGYAMFMGSSGAFIAVSVMAVEAGGCALLGTLTALGAVIMLLFAWSLKTFRHTITPTVGGVIMMLIVVSVFPKCTDLLAQVPPGKAGWPALIPALVTFASLLLISFYGNGFLKKWGPILGVAIGFVSAIPCGLVDFTPVLQAPWIGLPAAGWPGLDLRFDASFWSLLPAFLIVSAVGAIRSFGDSVAIQRVSTRVGKPIDFERVQGSLRVNGIGNCLAGLLGTVAIGTYSTSISMIEFTKVAARRTAFCGGILLLLFAWCPKLFAFLTIIPNPVVGGFLIVILAMLFSAGVRLIASEGLNTTNGLLVGLSFWIGTAFQDGMIFPNLIPPWLDGILADGVTSGGMTAILLSLMIFLRRRSAGRLVITPSPSMVQQVQEFLSAGARRQQWDHSAINRLVLVGEEAFLAIVESKELSPSKSIRLRLHFEGNMAEVEFATGRGPVDLETAVGNVKPGSQPSAGGEDSGLRILRSMVEQLVYRKYEDGCYIGLLVSSRPL